MRSVPWFLFVAMVGCACASPTGTASSAPSPQKTAVTAQPKACPPATPAPSPTPPADTRYRLVFHPADNADQRRFVVAPKLQTFGVQTSWDSGTVFTALVSPSGKRYDRLTVDRAAHHSAGAGFESWAFVRPEDGGWTIVVSAGTVPSAGIRVSVDVIQIPLSAVGPFVDFVTQPDRGVAPVRIQFTSEVTTAQPAVIASYSWDFGDCSPADSNANPTHVYRAAGSYRVMLTVIDSDAQSGWMIQTIVVTGADQPPTANFAWAVLDASRPSQVSFDAHTSDDVDGQVVTFQWEFGDGFSVTGDTVLHSYAKPGTYTVRLTVTDNGGLSATTCAGVNTVRRYGTSGACGR